MCLHGHLNCYTLLLSILWSVNGIFHNVVRLRFITQEASRKSNITNSEIVKKRPSTEEIKCRCNKRRMNVVTCEN